VHILDIGLHPDYLSQVTGESELLDEAIISDLQAPEKLCQQRKFRSCLADGGQLWQDRRCRAGGQGLSAQRVGLLTCQVPGCGYGILQTTMPEAMILTIPMRRSIPPLPGDLHGMYSVVGIGPGIGHRQPDGRFPARYSSAISQTQWSWMPMP
jgi:hypothetical protein